MSSSPEPDTIAWQPLTPRGIAAFAGASSKRLLLVQFLFAVLVASCVVWFFDSGWSPVIQQAIQQFPAKGGIRAGKLDWPDAEPQSLAEGHFLALTVDLNHTRALRSPAHVQAEFGRSSIRFISLFGNLDCSYPAGVSGFNRTEAQPWWGAWKPPILWITFTIAIVVLIAVWAILAAIYLWPVWLVGFFANRQLRLSDSWRLSGAALMPGALLLMAAILFYGLGVLDLVQLITGAIAHCAVGFIYSIASVLWVRKLPGSSRKRNPFAR